MRRLGTPRHVIAPTVSSGISRRACFVRRSKRRSVRFLDDAARADPIHEWDMLKPRRDLRRALFLALLMGIGCGGRRLDLASHPNVTPARPPNASNPRPATPA